MIQFKSQLIHNRSDMVHFKSQLGHDRSDKTQYMLVKTFNLQSNFNAMHDLDPELHKDIFLDRNK